MIHQSPLLSQLLFTSAPLNPGYEQVRISHSSLRTCIPTKNGSHSLAFGLPLFVHDSRILCPGLRKRFRDSWLATFQLLRDYELPVVSSYDEFHAVPTDIIPQIITRRRPSEPIRVRAMGATNAVILECDDPTTGLWGWPEDMVSTTLLGKLITALRIATGGAAPIGVSLPLGACQSDFAACLSAGSDFLLLVASIPIFDPQLNDAHVCAIVRAREYCKLAGTGDVPLLVDVPLTDPTPIPKLLALGASALCLDGLIAPLLEKYATATEVSTHGSGMLSGLGEIPVKVKPTLAEVETCLKSVRGSLLSIMQLVGAEQLPQLDCQTLRAISSEAQRVSGAPLL